VSAADFPGEQAGSFGAAAAAYARGRPPYPPQALDWLLAADARRVLDLGAGTGKLTVQLLARGLDVIAVEPSSGMRAELRGVAPGARVLAGTAEEIPVPDATVDTVLVAQAWHWVDPVRAVPEVARVLTPGGRIGLLWNIRDERQRWVARLGQIMHRGVEQDMRSDDPPVGPPFAPIQRHDVEWTHRLSRDALLDLVASRSYVITLPADRRTALLDQVRDLLAEHPDLAGEGDILLPYVTRCTRADLPPAR
jgi:SAM-dependent methyltransferase